jgi:hypothetical protein
MLARWFHFVGVFQQQAFPLFSFFAQADGHGV